MTREEKQVHIIRAAIKVLSEYGLDGTKMELVAREAGIGKGTIYEYFAGKEKLFEEMIIYSVQSYSQGLKQSMDQGDCIEEKLLNCICYNMDFFNENLDMLLMAMQINVFSQEMRQHMEEQSIVIFQHCRDMVEKAQAKGELRSDLDPELASFLINGTIDQYIKQRVFSKKSPPTRREQQALVEVMLQGLR